MEYLDHLLGEWLHSLVQHEVKCSKVVRGLYNVIYLDSLVCDPYGIGFKDIACLLMGQLAPFYMVAIVAKINLGTMIDPTP